MTSGLRAGLSRAARLAFLLPPAFVVVLVALYAVDVPYWDTWDWLDRHYPADPAASGSVPRRYWPLFNDHRVFVPLMVDRLLLLASGIDILPRIWLKLPLSMGTLWLTLRLARQTTPASSLPWVAGGLACLAFPLTYWPMWIDPRQFSIHIVVLAMMAGLVAATSRRRPVTRALLSGVACGVASLSYAPGLLTWPFLGLVLWCHPPRPSAPVLAVWLACATVAGGLQAFDLRDGSTQAAAAAPDVLTAASAAFSIAGLPVAPALSRLAYLPTRLVGLCGLAALPCLALLAWRLDADSRRRALPWIALGGWGASYAVATGWARGGLPLGALHDPRFAYVAAQIWVALVVLLVQNAGQAQPVSGRPHLRRRLAALVGIALAMSYGVASLRPFLGTGGVGRLSATLETGRLCLQAFRTADDTCLALLYPEPSRLREIAARLQAHGAAFLPPAPPQPGEAGRTQREPLHQGQRGE